MPASRPFEPVSVRVPRQRIEENEVRLAYVIDAREADGHLFRAPKFIAALFCSAYRWNARRDIRFNREYGYAPAVAGL